MISAPLPVDEADRLAALEICRLVNTAPEPAFEQLASIVAEVMGTPIAFLSLVESESCNVVGASGLQSGLRPRGVAFCGYTILGDPLIVRDTHLDERFQDNPMVVGSPFIRSFFGVPVRAMGHAVGALSVIDQSPRDWGESDLRRLEGFATIAESILELRLGSIRHAVTEKRIQSYVESTPVALAVYDDSDRLLLSNSKWRETFLGHPEAKAEPGTPFRELLDRIDAVGRRYRIEGQDPDWRERRLELRRRGRGSHTLEIDGAKWLLCHETLTDDGELVVAFTDVTAVKEREAFAAAQAALLRTTLENIDQGLALFDSDRRLMACSEAFFDLLDVPPGLRKSGTRLETIILDLLRRSALGDRVVGNTPPSLDELLGHRSTRHFELRLDCGRVLSTTVSPLADGRLIVTCLDVTDRKEVERLKDEFVSTVSHELRTPLTSIAGSLGLMAAGAAGELPPKAARLVGIAHRNADRLTRLVNDLLDIDKVESGQMRFELDRIDLNALAAQAVEQSHPMAQRVDVSIEADTGSQPIIVEGDINRLLQVAGNLISNAVKYSAPGQSVTVVAGHKGGRACLSVIDRGPGIPEQFRSRIFGRFSQADSSDRRSQEGTGLGLAIALAIAQRHGGNVSYESTEGIGTRFDLELPLAEPAPPPKPAAAGGRCLVCHADPALSGAVRDALEECGLAVEQADSSEAAMRALRAGWFDVLVADLGLPDGDGIDLVRRVRTERGGTDLAVIVTASRPDPRRQTVEAAALNILDWIEGELDVGRLAGAVMRRRKELDRTPLVLHVEDATDLAQLVSIALGDTAEVELAADLETARARLTSKRYDVVILDIGLPDGLALELLPLIGAGPRPPAVVIFSGMETSDDVVARVDRVLMKSRTSVRQLAEIVQEIVRERVDG